MSHNQSEKFLSRWRAATATLGLNETKSKEVGDYLLAHYSASSRHYHNVRHIISMLDSFDALKTSFAQPIAAELAIFFHDVIYDASRNDNEEQSAIRMREMLARFVADDVANTLINAAAFTIKATKSHSATPNADTNLLLDLDMAILGQPWPEYERYAKGVMQEYLPVYGEKAYREGRPKLFLEPTIAHGNIFLTKAFEHLNEPAIRNMQREADILKSGKSFADQER